MADDIRKVNDLASLIEYFSHKLCWNIDISDFDDIDDITYGFEASDIGLKDEAFAKITSLRQLPPIVDGQKWGIFCVEFSSQRFEVSALRKVLSGLIPKRRNSADHAVWNQKDLLFICFWGSDNSRTIGIAHFEEQQSGLPQIKMISCAPAMEDFTQIRVFEDRLSRLAWPEDTNTEKWSAAWSAAFDTGYHQVIHDSSTLTIQLAAEAQNIRDRILEVLSVESANGYVHLLLEKFRNTLIHDMTEQQFADMYAQTVVYGLFSARCMDKSQEDFSAVEAVNCIPNTNPFLKSLMKECLGSENNSKLSFDELEIGDVVDLLRHTNTEAIIRDFNRQTGGGREDPVIHFYEEFLTAYDKTQKVQRGVYYTPQPVVNFIVRAVDDILKSEFGIAEGLASTEAKTIKVKRESRRKVDGFIKQVDDTEEVPAIQILDPATGTGTFLRQTIIQIWENFKAANQGKSETEINRLWNEYVPKHLLPRLNGFELMMAPYAVAHMKLAMVLKETGYDFSGDERVKVFLTNSLEEPGNASTQLSIFDDPLAAESVEANQAKKNSGINVVIGNPPYSGISSNGGEWITRLIEDYKYIDGVHFGERKHWLQDDYVKFIRMSEQIISQSENGILAFINNHAFLDNPTFRCMRYHLLQTFNRVFIINLHGNSLLGERCPDGEKDENVFDIQQGVSINIFIKVSNRAHQSLARINRQDIYGTRELKYEWLRKSLLAEIPWQEVHAVRPYYFFEERNLTDGAKYFAGISLKELFIKNVMGITTARDFLVIDSDRDRLLERMTHFSDLSYSDDQIRDEFFPGKQPGKYLSGDTRGWMLSRARRTISHFEHAHLIRSISYRPFDKRYIYYCPEMVDWDRANVMNNFIFGENLGLCLIRINRDNHCTALVVDDISDKTILSSKDNANVFPLFTYSGNGEHKVPNLDLSLVNIIEKRLGIKFVEKRKHNVKTEFDAFDLFFYIYSVLYSPSYCDKYADFLKSDFPCVPYPTNQEIFWKLVELGNELKLIHLVESSVFDDIDADPPVNGKNPIGKATYRDGNVYVNKLECFHDVPELAWNFYIGGYQPAQKWLKDRKGIVLSADDIKHYRKIIRALEETDRIMKEIDKVFEF